VSKPINTTNSPTMSKTHARLRINLYMWMIDHSRK
jgi:hypothetical protein